MSENFSLGLARNRVVFWPAAMLIPANKVSHCQGRFKLGHTQRPPVQPEEHFALALLHFWVHQTQDQVHLYRAYFSVKLLSSMNEPLAAFCPQQTVIGEPSSSGVTSQ